MANHRDTPLACAPSTAAQEEEPQETRRGERVPAAPSLDFAHPHPAFAGDPASPGAPSPPPIEPDWDPGHSRRYCRPTRRSRRRSNRRPPVRCRRSHPSRCCPGAAGGAGAHVDGARVRRCPSSTPPGIGRRERHLDRFMNGTSTGRSCSRRCRGGRCSQSRHRVRYRRAGRVGPLLVTVRVAADRHGLVVVGLVGSPMTSSIPRWPGPGWRGGWSCPPSRARAGCGAEPLAGYRVHAANHVAPRAAHVFVTWPEAHGVLHWPLEPGTVGPATGRTPENSAPALNTSG